MTARAQPNEDGNAAPPPDGKDRVFDLRQVTFTYAGGVEPVLSDISLTVSRGEFVGIVGPTGCGKTTLLYILSGVIPHYYQGHLEGDIRLLGRDTQELSLSRVSAKVGLVMQDPEAQLFNLYVNDEVVWGMECRAYPRDVMDQRAVESLSRFNIEHLRRRVTFDLSGGEKQKVAIAAIDAVRPDVIIFDNPTSQLDPLGCRMVFEAVHELVRRRHTIVMVEDNLNELAAYADRIVVVDDGRIQLDAPVAEFCRRRDVLAACGLRLPQMVELAHELEAAGVVLDPFPTNLDQGKQVIGRLVGSSHAAG